MPIIEGLRTWWQQQTGEEDTPFDGDTPAFFASMVFHLCFMLTLAFLYQAEERKHVSLVITAPLEEEKVPELTIPKEVAVSELPSDKIGANSTAGTEMAFAEAPTFSEISSEIPTDVPETTTDFANVSINLHFEKAVAPHVNQNFIVKGADGVGEKGAEGAVDRITKEILLSLEERKTLVVWLFDQTASLKVQRNSIRSRFDKIYEELGVLEAAGNDAFAKHHSRALLTSVISFGKSATLRTKQPTDSLTEIKKAIDSIEDDNSGEEHIFKAVRDAAEWFRRFRLPDENTRKPERNVLLIAITDEAGSDPEVMEDAVRACRRYEMPVYIIGAPAPFGRKETLVKWIDPDPKFDQTAQWGSVTQGPESLVPERIKLSYFNAKGGKAEDDVIDSGFGPYGLTRLCYETGGIFFAVHPNRNVNRAISRDETANLTAHYKQFFDPAIMRKYRPDYVPIEEYRRRVTANKARLALVKASERSEMSQMDSPVLRFVKSSEAAFANELSEAQKSAAKVEPEMEMLYGIMKDGEVDREKESSLRWQAGYDLAMGRVMAAKVRTESYNAMLAAAKRGLKFKNEKNNTWVLEPADEITTDSKSDKMAQKAREYLNRVVTDHPSTPWAMLAQKELDSKIGWKWKEEHTDLNPKKEGPGGDAAAAAAAADAMKMLKKPAPKRPIPNL